MPPERLADDVRWDAARRVAASPHFSRSILLSRFLMYIVAETIEGREQKITEHQIGVKVFDRPAGYRTVEDNIVRNYARQLRKRLSTYYATEGAHDPVKIDIPLGGYVPAFHPAAKAGSRGAQSSGPQAVEAPEPEHAATRAWTARSGTLLLVVMLGIAYTGAVAGIAWFLSAQAHTARPAASPARLLWHALLDSPLNTYIIPSDAGLNLLEDVSQQSIPLAEYIKTSYLHLPLPAINAHGAEDLHSQEFTSFVDLQAVAALERLPDFHPGHDIVRFPRALHLDDLKSANAVILGAEGSNPWAAIAEQNANFRILYQPGMRGATVVNSRPRPGERAVYASHWNEPAHETFALIEYLPNLNDTGHILLLQGLDVAGTQAAVDALFHPQAIAPILKRAQGPDGTLKPFEILLRSTSIASDSADTQVVASRID